MFGRTAEEAVDRWVASLRAAIQCVATAEAFPTGADISRRNSIFVVSSAPSPDSVLSLRLGRPGVGLTLKVFIDYTVAQDTSISSPRAFRVDILKYTFHVANRDEHELFAYHWHPDGHSHVRDPHLHIKHRPFVLTGGPDRDIRHELAIDKAHFPTGTVTLRQVIRLLIEDLGVEPRTPNWRQVLEPGR